jgi:hypothetical protein
MKWIIPLLLFLVSCLQDSMSPEAALKNFIESRVGNVVTREYILEMVTGKMKQSLKNISEQDFIKFADLRNIQRESFKILSKSCQKDICFLTYSIGYRTLNKDVGVFTTEVKKIAELVNENGKWLIADVSNIKTYHESHEAINPLE